MFFRIFKNRLRRKFVIVAGSVTVLPLAVAMIVSIFYLRDIQRENLFIHDRHIAQIAAGKVEGFVLAQFQILADIGIGYAELLQNPERSDFFVEQFLYKSGNFAELTILDSDGMEIARENIINVVLPGDFRDRSNSEEFRALKESGYYIGPQYIERGKPFFVIAHVVRGIDGSFRGGVVAVVDARIMQDVVKSVSVRSEQAYIVNSEGIILAHPDVSEVLRERNVSMLPAVRSAIYADSEVDLKKPYANQFGMEVIGAGIPITVSTPGEFFASSILSDWVVVVEQPASVALVPVKQVTEFSLIVLSLSLLLGIITAILLANSLTSPIRELQRGAKQIGLGNLDYLFKVDTNDELEDLAVELDKMRLRLKRVRQREENLSKLKSEFVSIAAHQLRTPLSNIKWAISLFEESNPEMSGEQRDLVKKMVLSNERMIRLVDDLLDAARIEEGRFVYNRTAVKPKDLVESVLQRVEQKAFVKKVFIEFHEPKEALPVISVDKDAMSLALQNIIENAINYNAPKGEVDISVTRTSADSLLISVEDNGIGIDEQGKERIFSKFFRGSNAIKLATEGSGLGLFIAKNIVESHGGKIWFESKEGKGTVFHFTIPISK